MKKIFYILVSLVVILIIGIVLVSGTSFAAKGGKYAGCTTIQDGTLVDSAKNPISVGYDQFGYNYQAYMFNGRYCDSDRVIDGPYCHVDLIMKWNDAWLSNKDCNNDDTLDRPSDFNSYISSGAWLTNHQKATEEDGCKWEYFVKMVAKPTADFDCTSVGGTEIWGSFCRIQQIYNSNCEGDEWHGVLLLAKPAGFGAWK